MGRRGKGLAVSGWRTGPGKEHSGWSAEHRGRLTAEGRACGTGKSSREFVSKKWPDRSDTVGLRTEGCGLRSSKERNGFGSHRHRLGDQRGSGVGKYEDEGVQVSSQQHLTVG